MTHDHPNTVPPPFPTTSSYTPLPEYEASTPQTFFTAKEVLYASLESCSISIPRSAIADYDEWVGFFGTDNTATANGQPSNEEWLIKKGASGFVGSGYVTLLPLSTVIDPQAQPITSNPARPPAGLQIPYPSIHLHAVRVLKHSAPEIRQLGLVGGEERGALYLQIEMGPRPGVSADETEDEEGSTVVEVLVIPDVVASASAGAAVDGSDVIRSSHLNGTNPQQSSAPNMLQVQDIYAAFSTCQDLHPDPEDEESDEDGNPRAPRGGLAGLLAGMGGGGAGMPGEGGWITSENAHLFEGQFPDVDDPLASMDGDEADEDVIPLGPGAGTRREREGDDDDTANGMAAGEDELKWQRTG